MLSKLLGHDKLLIECICRSESGTSENSRMLNKMLKEANGKTFSSVDYGKH